jgi:SAM-dependent methyltransferase
MPSGQGIDGADVKFDVATRRASARLFAISFAILFLELACIRWFGSIVPFLAYFSNLVLLACFLGMAAGCLAASRRGDWAGWTLPLACVSIALSLFVEWLHYRFGHVLVDVGGAASPQQVYFGAEYVARNLGHFFVPIEGVATVFFLLITLVFFGLGQALGRAFGRGLRPVVAYSINIAGSLAGIVAFAIMSFAQAPPAVWFGTGGLVFCVAEARSPVSWIAWAALVGLVYFGGGGNGGDDVRWSPYYRVRMDHRLGGISVNNISHQYMVDLDEIGVAYVLPYLLTRDAGVAGYKDVLVIGAGSGNDVAAALRFGAERVDAVDIEPVILDIGRAAHPNAPYADARVRTHLTDGRRFVARTDETYDLVAYALPDSLMLHSGYASLRLESFLFTKEAFEAVRSRLRPGGIFALYNVYRQWWVAARVAALARAAFGVEPIVISLPYRPEIGPDSPTGGAMTMVLVSNGRSDRLEAIRGRLRGAESFWVNEQPKVNEGVNGYGGRPPATGSGVKSAWYRIDMAEVAEDLGGRLPADDWPFLYLRAPGLPDLNVRGIALLAAISALVLWRSAPGALGRLSWPMFFLGAGFMLLETRATVQMALLFGSTWVVSSVVIGSILVMILLSNLVVLRFRPKRLRMWFALVLGSVCLNLLLRPGWLLGLPEAVRMVVACGAAFAPVFFAGVVFAVLFERSTRPEVALGSNIAGAIVGGLSENLSLVFGFGGLLWVALAFYAAAAWSCRERGSAKAG